MSNRLAFLRRNSKPTRTTDIDRAALEFQPDAVMIAERPLPWSARSVVYIVAALVIFTALWATFSKVDRIVVARGKLVTTDPLMVVQPLQTGIIRSIKVHAGDFVQAGAELATLDPTFTKSQAVAARQRLASMTAEESRLDAEIYGRAFPPHDANLDPGYERLQKSIYIHRQAEYKAAVSSDNDEIKRVEAALATNRNAQKGLEQRISVIGAIEKIRERLYGEKLGSRLNLLQTRLDRLQLSDRLQTKKNEETELRQQLAAAQEKKARYINNWLRKAGERLATVQQEISSEEQKLTSAKHLATLVTLRAPAAGTVLELAHRSIGSVAKAAEPLITLVPRDNHLEAEVDIKSADIAHLRTGDRVRLKLDALPFQQHGTIPGVLKVISENSFEPDKSSGRAALDPDGQPSFFRGRVALGRIDLRNVPKNFRLIPGMTGSAEILIGKRTIISYILDPVVRLFDDSLREP